MALLSLPVLIHLINMMRHRRVKWAAMEFLLESQRKHRRWIILKQLLLLLLRMAAVAAIVLMVAQPLLQSSWGKLFGGTRTHHILLLDDSFSMNDRWANSTAFDKAKQVVQTIGEDAAARGTAQTFTLLPFSVIEDVQAGRGAPLMEALIDDQFTQKLEAALGQLEVTQQTYSPAEALSALGTLLEAPEGESRIVYLVSDYRQRDWEELGEVKEGLDQLEEWQAKINLVACVDSQHSNLGITGLSPLPGIRAAAVPLFMEVEVRNFGPQDANNVNVLLEEDGNARPAVAFKQIPAGKSATTRFLVNFTTAGEHRIAARLESDSVDTDNERFAVVDFPIGVPVLVIDGNPESGDARYLVTAFAPGGTSKTGVNPQIEPPRFLANNPLDKFQAIYLVNVPRLDETSIKSLEDYVRTGGGVGFFLGETIQRTFYNESLYRDGEGLFPLPLGPAMELLLDQLETPPDLEVTDHPIFRILAGERNSFISTVGVARYFTASEGWKPEPDSPVSVIASLRNGAPLVVESRYGQGRVVAFLTTAGPVWNNWAKNPSYVVTILETQAHLSATRRPDEERLVGQLLVVPIDPTGYKPAMEFVAPTTEEEPLPVDAVQSDAGQNASLEDTSQAGIYEARLTTNDGQRESRTYAYNVEADEGDLAYLDGSQLDGLLRGVSFEYHPADAFQVSDFDLGGMSLSTSLIYLLVLFMIGEQLLAYSASYHPSRKGGA
jgi:hypothetical protein